MYGKTPYICSHTNQHTYTMEHYTPLETVASMSVLLLLASAWIFGALSASRTQANKRRARQEMAKRLR